jgi:hypothetical protein
MQVREQKSATGSVPTDQLADCGHGVRIREGRRDRRAAWRGCTPTTSYIDEALGERTAVMEMEMVMVCSGKAPQTPT